MITVYQPQSYFFIDLNVCVGGMFGKTEISLVI